MIPEIVLNTIEAGANDINQELGEMTPDLFQYQEPPSWWKPNNCFMVESKPMEEGWWGAGETHESRREKLTSLFKNLYKIVGKHIPFSERTKGIWTFSRKTLCYTGTWKIRNEEDKKHLHFGTKP